jgi:hypothetical protein
MNENDRKGEEMGPNIAPKINMILNLSVQTPAKQ